MSDDEVKAVLENAPIAFSLEAQGHIPTIQAMRDEGKSWREIGDRIGWMAGTAEEHYLRWCERKAKLASWYALMARGAVKGNVEWWTDPLDILWAAVFPGGGVGRQVVRCTKDANGLPLEDPELRTALEKALDQPGETP